MDLIEATQEQLYTVTKSNHLIEASYKLTLNEQRLLLITISQIDPRKPIPRTLTVSARDFSEMFGLPSNKAYEALAEATDNLYERDFRTYDAGRKERFRWVDRCEYNKGEGAVTLSFTQWVAPYLSKLNSQFTSYRLKHVSTLRSVYSIRLFEMLMQYKNTGILITTVTKFRERLMLEDKYDRYTNMKERVIRPAIKELADCCGLEIGLTEIKRGRTIERLHFHFKARDQMMLSI